MIARELAKWGLGVESVPDDVTDAALRHMLDGIANAVAGYRSGAADPAIEVARGLGGSPEATILGTDLAISAPAAALANGTLVHALDFDDTHAGGLVHATAVTLPTALAVGQQVGASGKNIFIAAVVGYETACRVAAAAPHGFHARGLHATMIAGVFSSALVASKLMRLDVDETTHALGIAGSQAGGLLAFIGTGASTKQLHPGFASQAGIIAARLAKAGATGPDTVFDGPHGIYDTFVEGASDRASVIADLGTRWETTQIGIKPYPACQLSHTSMDAMKNAREQRDFTVDDIVEIHAHVHPDSASVVCDTSRDLTKPASPYAAKFSLPWSVAAVAIDGNVTAETFDEAGIARQDVSALAAKVTVEITPFDGYAADAPGKVRVHLTDGSIVTGTVTRSAGGPENPVNEETLLAKFGNVHPDKATRVRNTLYEIQTLETIDPLIRAVTDAAREQNA